MNIFYLGLAILLLFGLWFFYRRDDISRFVSNPSPVTSYEESIRLYEISQEKGSQQELNEACRNKLMTHGSQTERVIVLMHGYTNCPEQFLELGKCFFHEGYNVFIPCMPFHGYADRLTRDLSKLTVEDLVTYGDSAVDLARGLGRHVTVFGLSGGGTVAAWLAQNREDIDLAVPVAPFLRIYKVPGFLTLPFINFFKKFPDRYVWWDPRSKEQNPLSPDYAYPQFSFRALTQILRLARATKIQAKQKPPVAKKIQMVMNDFDIGVSNDEIESLLKIWMSSRKEGVGSYHFDREMKMMHDIITPGWPGIPHDQVYQTLVDLVSEQPAHSAVL